MVFRPLTTGSTTGGFAVRQGVSLGPVPMALARFDVSNVTNLGLASLGFYGDPPAAGGCAGPEYRSVGSATNRGDFGDALQRDNLHNLARY